MTSSESSRKNVCISLRTMEYTKKKLVEEAEKRGWSFSQLVERILSAYAEGIDTSFGGVCL